MISTASIDELIRSDFGQFLMIVGESANTGEFGMPHFFEVVVRPKEEIVAWLRSKDVPQLLNGSYWREFSDFSVHGSMETEGVPGRDPIEPYFRLIVVRQSPKSIFT